MAAAESDRALRVRLTPTARQEAARQAAQCGLDLAGWLGQVVEAHCAELRCQHGPPRPPDGNRTTEGAPSA